MTALKGEGISAFFPCYNDQETIAEVVEKALRVLEELTDDYEVIVVDDGSTDDSPTIVDELASRHSRVRVVHHEKNRGYGTVVRTGIAHSTKDWIFYTDGDGQYDVEQLRLLYENREGAEVVNGYKVNRSDPWYRKLLGGAYNLAVRTLFRLPIRDVDCDFRLLRGNIARSLELRSSGGAICVEMIKALKAAGCRFKEVPVVHLPRRAGRSQFFRPRHLAVMCWELLVVALRPAGFRPPVEAPGSEEGVPRSKHPGRAPDPGSRQGQPEPGWTRGGDAG